MPGRRVGGRGRHWASFLSHLHALACGFCHSTLPPSAPASSPPKPRVQPEGALKRAFLTWKPGCPLCPAVCTLPRDLREPRPHHVTCDLPSPLLAGIN